MTHTSLIKFITVVHMVKMLQVLQEKHQGGDGHGLSVYLANKQAIVSYPATLDCSIEKMNNMVSPSYERFKEKFESSPDLQAEYYLRRNGDQHVEDMFSSNPNTRARANEFFKQVVKELTPLGVFD
jgi:hypothetical protein